MTEKLRVWPGEPHPRGATWDGKGGNFALSAHAERVELCLFGERGRRELHRRTLPEYTNRIWHGYVSDLRPGQLYGYRVHARGAAQALRGGDAFPFPAHSLALFVSRRPAGAPVRA